MSERIKPSREAIAAVQTRYAQAAENRFSRAERRSYRADRAWFFRGRRRSRAHTEFQAALTHRRLVDAIAKLDYDPNFGTSHIRGQLPRYGHMNTQIELVLTSREPDKAGHPQLPVVREAIIDGRHVISEQPTTAFTKQDARQIERVLECLPLLQDRYGESLNGPLRK